MSDSAPVETVWPLPKIRYQTLASVEEDRDVALFISRDAWEAVRDTLPLNVACEREVMDATRENWEQLGEDLAGEVVYAVGGGLAVDGAKYVAAQQGLPLVCVPTALSVDAFLTWASGYREAGCVRYAETKPPDELIVDFEVLRRAPQSIRAAGVCDVLSIATGLYDWEYAESKQANPEFASYDPHAAAVAKSILEAQLASAESAGRGEPEGLRRLLECLALEVQLCNLIGHSRPEEGSEHYFAYAAEEALGKGLPHGDLVGPGIVVAAHLQGQETEPLVEALGACNVPLDRIPAASIRAILEGLPAYCRKHDLPHGIAHDLTQDMTAGVDWAKVLRGKG